MDARVVATVVDRAGRGRPPLRLALKNKSARLYFSWPRFNNCTIYIFYIYIENDLVRLWIPAGALPLDPWSLALRFVRFTHSACHYYSQKLFSTTQIGMATTRWTLLQKSQYGVKKRNNDAPLWRVSGRITIVLNVRFVLPELLCKLTTPPLNMPCTRYLTTRSWISLF